MNSFSLQNKTIVITGASSGIGRGCAIECSKYGAHLILIARNEQELSRTQSLLSEDTKSEIIVSDITKDEDLENKLSEKIGILGKISGFIHCAGIEKTIPLKKQNPQLFNDVFNINVVAGFEIAKLLSLKKYKADSTSFVFISSVAGLVGEVGKTIYSASKGAVVSGARSMAMELVKSNIRVNAISPAMVNTPILENMFQNIGEEAATKIAEKHPLGIGDVKDVANAAIFLLSDASRWITGTNLVVDGGYSAQ